MLGMELTCGVTFGGDGPVGGGGGGSCVGPGGGGGGWTGVVEPSMTARLCDADVNGGGVATEKGVVPASGLQWCAERRSPICLTANVTFWPT